MWGSAKGSGTLDTGLVGGDGGTLDADVVLLDGMGSVDGDLVVGGISVLHAQIVVLDVDVQEGQDKLFLDHLPDDTGLFIAVELDDGIVDLDLLFH